ncbi:MAG: hypothetical protein WC815_07100 [Vicinamibacterales bacterium]
MANKITESVDHARLAEYEALRAESDRSAQLLSNAVWAGVTGFGLTLAGAAAVAANGPMPPLVVPAVALLLSIQSLAMTTVYASELWKYIRVGTYIREYIEPYFRLRAESSAPPMQWESWIAKHRATLLHISALLFLQGPIGVTFSGALLLVGVWMGWLRPADGTSVKYVAYLGVDYLLFGALLLVIAVDVGMMIVLHRKLRQAEAGNFGDGGDSLRALAADVGSTGP